MPENLFSLRKRLEKVERSLARMQRQKRLANCNCLGSITVCLGKEAEFAREMSLPCPAHGVRNLGRIVRLDPVPPGRGPEPASRLDGLLAIYEASDLAKRDQEAVDDYVRTRTCIRRVERRAERLVEPPRLREAYATFMPTPTRLRSWDGSAV
jgi:hypothetical protein